VPKTTPFGLMTYLAILALNVFLMCGAAWVGWNEDKQKDQRRRALEEAQETNRRLEATLAENAGLHAQLLAQAREAGVLDERQRMAREIHDTLAQGLAGIITQLQATEQADEVPARWHRHIQAATRLARESWTARSCTEPDLGFLIQEGRGDRVDPFGIGDRVDLGDLAVDDREAHHGDGPPAHGDDHSGCPVHQGWVQLRDPQAAREPSECLPGDSRRAADRHGSCAASAGIDPQHHAGIEHGDESVEIAPARSGEEGIHHLALAGQIGVLGW
jgi:hypothetical protein